MVGERTAAPLPCARESGAASHYRVSNAREPGRLREARDHPADQLGEIVDRGPAFGAALVAADRREHLGQLSDRAGRIEGWLYVAVGHWVFLPSWW